MRLSAILSILVVMTDLTAQGSGAPSLAPHIEKSVKAAYLLNFTRYTEWPTGTLPGPDAPLKICLLGTDHIEEALTRITTGRSSNGHPLEVHSLDQMRDATSCNLIFVGHSQEGSQLSLLADVYGKPILTIGESASFLNSGGVIQFVTIEDTVRFEVNIEAMRQAGLKISSRALALAANIIK